MCVCEQKREFVYNTLERNQERGKQQGMRGGCLAPGARSCRDHRFAPGAGQYVNLFAIKFDISLANIEYRVLNIR